MCEPISTTAAVMIGISAFATMASTGLAAYGQYQSVQAKNKANQYNAALADRAAQQSAIEAQYATERGAIEEKQWRLKVANLKGDQRAAYASSGLVVDDGSPLTVLQDTAGFGELDALAIRQNAALESWKIRNQGANATAQANLYRSSTSSPGLPMAGSLLTGASSLASTLYQSNKAGVWGSSRPSSIPALAV